MFVWVPIWHDLIVVSQYLPYTFQILEQQSADVSRFRTHFHMYSLGIPRLAALLFVSYTYEIKI